MREGLFFLNMTMFGDARCFGNMRMSLLAVLAIDQVDQHGAHTVELIDPISDAEISIWARPGTARVGGFDHLLGFRGDHLMYFLARINSSYVRLVWWSWS